MSRRVRLRLGERDRYENYSDLEAQIRTTENERSTGSGNNRTDGESSDHSNDSSNDTSGSDNALAADGDSEEDLSDDSDTSHEQLKPDASLKDISFGALLEAQSTFPPKSRKRKAHFDSDLNSPEPNLIDSSQTDYTKTPKPSTTSSTRPTKNSLSRNSKHAPTLLSSKQQVSRHRSIFDPSPSLKYRDPRFDPTIQSGHDNNSISSSNKNYSFLTTYQNSELQGLKQQLAQLTAKPSKSKSKTKFRPAQSSEASEADIATLKRQIASLESKLRNAATLSRQREIQAEHKRSEKAAIARGEKAKPYYLKDSDVKKKIREERIEGMSAKARTKMEGRKEKREKGKEGQSMPRVRREG